MLPSGSRICRIRCPTTDAPFGRDFQRGWTQAPCREGRDLLDVPTPQPEPETTYVAIDLRCEKFEEEEIVTVLRVSKCCVRNTGSDPACLLGPDQALGSAKVSDECWPRCLTTGCS